MYKRQRYISQDVRVILRKRMGVKADVDAEAIRTGAEADSMTVAEMIATGKSAGVRAESRKKTAASKWAGNPEGMTIMRRVRNPAGTSAVKKARSLQKKNAAGRSVSDATATQEMRREELISELSAA